MSKHVTFSLTLHTIVIGMIVIILLCITLVFTGYKIYEKILATEATQKMIIENQDKERLAQDKKSQDLITLQQQSLQQTQNELTKTKIDAAQTNAQIKTLAETLESQTKVPKDIIISSADLSPYMTGVVQVICSAPNNSISSGSGTLWTLKEIPYAVITNHHVVKDATSCIISITNDANVTIGMFSTNGSIYTFNQNTDEAILTIGQPISSQARLPVPNYNYSLAQVRKCTTLMPVGTPVVIIGFPAYAKRDSTLTIDTIGTINVIYRTATNGIISGYDTSQKGEANYFVSAKIDNGNSGGMTLAKDANGLCVLGLPTWLSVGNYETQGLVQNILNVLPR